jgi:hypothetical protein
MAITTETPTAIQIHGASISDVATVSGVVGDGVADCVGVEADDTGGVEGVAAAYVANLRSPLVES